METTNEQENQPEVAAPTPEKEPSPSKENVTPKTDKGWFSSLRNLRKSRSNSSLDSQKSGTLPPQSPPATPSKFSARSTIDGVNSQDTDSSNNNSVNKSESEDTLTDSSIPHNFEPSKQDSIEDTKEQSSAATNDSKKSYHEEAPSSSASTPSITRHVAEEQTGIITDLLCQIKELSMARATDTDLIGELRTDLAEAKKQMQVHVIKNAALNTELDDLKEKVTLLELNNKYFTHFYDLKSLPGSLHLAQPPADVNKVVTPQEEILQRFAQPFAITKLVREQEQLLEKKEQQMQQLLQQLEVQRTNNEFQKQLDSLPLPTNSGHPLNLSEMLSSSSGNLLSLLQVTPPTTPVNTTIGSNPFSEMVDETRQQKVNQEELVKILKREIFIRDEEIRRLKETIVPQIQQLKNQLKLKNQNEASVSQHQHTQTHDFKPNRSVSEDDSNFKLRHEYHVQQQQIEQQQQTILDLKLKLKDLQSDNDGSGLSSNEELQATNQHLQNSLKDHMATIESLKLQLKKSVEQQLHSHQSQQQAEQKCKQLETEIEGLRNSAIKQGSPEEVISVRTEIEKQAHKIELLNHEISALQKENTAQRKQINDLNTHNQQLLQEMEKLRSHQEKAQEELANEAKKYEAQWLEKQQQLDEVTQTAEDLRATLQKEHSKSEVKDLELKELKAKLLQVQEEVAKLQSDIQLKEEQHKTAVKKYDEKIKQNSEHTEDMQKQLEELRAEYRNNLNENSKLQDTSSQKIEQLQATITGQKTELELLQTKKVELQMQLENAQAGVATSKSENASLKQDLEQATSENSQMKITIQQLKGLIESLRSMFKMNLDQVRSQIKEQRAVVLDCHNKYFGFAVASVKQIQAGYDAITEEAKESILRYKLEVEKRRKLHNTIEDMKGKIRVYCRVRPLTQHEETASFKSCIDFPQADQMIVTQYTSSGKEEKKPFEFERVFTPQENQFKVFSEVKDLVTSVMDGYNVCIFAYGQTGSGKTYTMEGPESDLGINLRALGELFKLADERKKDYDYRITVCMLEIYNDALRDLFSENSLGLDLRQDENGGVYVPNLTEKAVASYDEVMQLLTIGKKNRSVASTGMNDQSSRSHMILKVSVKGRNLITDTIYNASLSLIDLAGSERVSRSGAMQQQMTETQHINKSLSTLGDVISALKNKQTHIPYRNSKLTHFLQDSLSGESKVLMIVQISPCRADAGESVCSLNFATRVNSVVVQTPKTPKKEQQQKEQKPPTPLSSPRKREKP